MSASLPRRPAPARIVRFALAGLLAALAGCGSDTSRQSRSYGMMGGVAFRDPMPMAELDCRKALKKLKVQYTDIAPIHDGPSCGIEWPVSVTGFRGGVKLEPAATLTCQMTVQVAKWTKEELRPSARFRYFSGIDTIRNGSSYRCSRIGGRGKWSAHASGNALDIMEIKLKNGRSIDVAKPGFFSFREKGMLNAVREDACPYFNTVLGPGYDRAHADHFHFDLMGRTSGNRVCK